MTSNLKYLALVLPYVLVISLFAGCSKDPLFSGTSPQNIQLVLPDRDILDIGVDYNRPTTALLSLVRAQMG